MPLPWFSKKPSPAIIDDPTWAAAVGESPFLDHLGEADLARLRELCEAFLRAKTISGAHEFPVTPQVRAILVR